MLLRVSEYLDTKRHHVKGTALLVGLVGFTHGTTAVLVQAPCVSSRIRVCEDDLQYATAVCVNTAVSVLLYCSGICLTEVPDPYLIYFLDGVPCPDLCRPLRASRLVPSLHRFADWFELV